MAPVVVGSSLAGRDEAFRIDALVALLVAAVAIQVGVNFANDVADAAKGADTPERIGPQRAVASGLISPRRMWLGIAVAFGISVVAGVYLIWLGGWPILAIGVASIAAALGYTNGPVPYGYRGLGEVFVFVFFGLAATVGSRWVYDRSAPDEAWVLAIPMGMLAAAILVANNIRDIDTDRIAGKRTLAVLMGRRRTVSLYATLTSGSFVVLAVAAAARVTPPGTLLSVAAVPFAFPLIKTLATSTHGPPLIGVLKGTARLQLLVAGLVSIGILL